MKKLTSDIWTSIHICLFFGIMYLISWPFLNFPVGDAFSYDWTVLKYLEYGRIIYGWTSAIVGIQIYYGVLISKLFGYSYRALNISILPLTLSTIVSIYFFFRLVSLKKILAVIGVGIIIAAPFFLVISTKFVTDIPNILFFTLALYSFVKAIRSEQPRSIIAWSIAMTITGFLGGTIRQTTWIVPLLFLPIIAWHHRQHRQVIAVSIAAWFISLGGIAWLSYWFSHQPYIELEPIMPQVLIFLKMLPALPPSLLSCITTTLVLFIPLWIVLWPTFVEEIHPYYSLKSFYIFLIGPLLFIISWVFAFTYYGLPFMLFIPDSMFDYSLPPIVYIVLLGVILVLLSILTIVIYKFIFRQVTLFKFKYSENHIILGSFIVYIVIYLGLITIRGAAENLVFDRYLLPIYILIIPLIGLYTQSKIIPRSAYIAAFGVLIIFASFSTMNVHDIFRYDKAIMILTDKLMAAGIPRTQIAAGFEFDGMTELLLHGYINDPRLKDSAHGYISRTTPVSPLTEQLMPTAYTPTYDPIYFIVSPVIIPFVKVPQGLRLISVNSIAVSSWLGVFPRLIVLKAIPIETNQ